MAYENNIKFNIPGRSAPLRADEILAQIETTIKVIESIQIRPPTRGADDFLKDKNYSPGTLIELEFESGAKRYIRADQLAEDLSARIRTRGEPEPAPGCSIVVPASFGGTSRGDSEMLAAFRVLDVSPWDPFIAEIAKSGAKIGAEKIAAYFEKHLTTGLFELTDPRELGREVTDPMLVAPDKPMLLLIHGTASSTVGSFSA